MGSNTRGCQLLVGHLSRLPPMLRSGLRHTRPADSEAAYTYTDATLHLIGGKWAQALGPNLSAHLSCSMLSKFEVATPRAAGNSEMVGRRCCFIEIRMG